MEHAELMQAARNEERQRESDRASMLETVVAGVVAGIEAQSQRTNTVIKSAANVAVQTRLTGSITTCSLLGDIPTTKGDGIDTDSLKWDTSLTAWIMAAGPLRALPDDPHGGSRLQAVLSLILKHPAKALADISDAEALISEGHTGVDHVLFTGAWPSLRITEVWSKIPKPLQEEQSAIKIFSYLVKLAPKNPAVEEEGVRTALYGAEH